MIWKCGRQRHRDICNILKCKTEKFQGTMRARFKNHQNMTGPIPTLPQCKLTKSSSPSKVRNEVYKYSKYNILCIFMEQARFSHDWALSVQRWLKAINTVWTPNSHRTRSTCKALTSDLLYFLWQCLTNRRLLGNRKCKVNLFSQSPS